MLQIAGLPSGSALLIGTTTQTFTASDATGNTSAQASFTVTVIEVPAPVNTAPVANDDATTLNSGDVVTITAGFDVTVNDTDDGTVDPSTVVITSATLTGLGSIVETAPGVWTYTVGSGFARVNRVLTFVGEESFTYTVLDNLGQVSNVATVTVTINPAP